jgi:hypothetical protein
MTVFPNVPLAPGVPPIPRQIGATEGAVAGIVLLTQDIASFFAGTLLSTWGIFQNNVQVVAADNVVSFEYKQEWTISDYPVEGGGFQSYDKVQLPFDVRLEFSKGGSVSDRQTFINSINTIAGNLQFYDVYTPELQYTSVNIQRWEYSRKSDSKLGLVVIDVWLIQIRVTATTTFQNVANPASANQVSNGQTQGMSLDSIYGPFGSMTLPPPLFH